MTSLRLRKSWFIRYKLYHIPFWILYSYVLWALYTGSPSDAAHEMFFSAFWAKCFCYMIFPALAVYFNLYYLIPRYLQKGRYVTYIGLLVLAIIAASFLIVPGYYFTAWLSGTTAHQMFGISTSLNGFYQAAKTEPFKSTLAAITLGMSIKLAKNWIETQRRHQVLEKEKLETELKFLKYQFNPHFLFNSINSIFFLIHKNPDMASASLAKFSELLRHQLYEGNDHLIPIDKELDYLENFIGLEKLRQNENLKVAFDAEDAYIPSLGIAPFILMTFVENAFKHVSKHKDEPNWIDLKITIANKELRLLLTNSKTDGINNEVVNYGGIGLKNVRRRLELLYPGRFELEIRDDADRFSVKCLLQLSELTTINP